VAGRRSPRVLCIGGSDPLGGAGLQMDAAACAALGGEAVGVATLDTVQRDAGLEAVKLHPPERVAREALRALEEGVQAVKLGALGDALRSEAVVETLLPWLEADDTLALVIDPVAAPTLRVSPDLVLNTPEGMRVVEQRLFRYAVVTPNALEYGDGSRYRGAMAVLRKGGHAVDWDALASGEAGIGSTEVEDIYTSVAGEELRFRHPRIAGATGLHGTGCALASSLATLLAWGLDPGDASRLAIDGLGQWLAAAEGQLRPFPPRGDLFDGLLA